VKTLLLVLSLAATIASCAPSSIFAAGTFRFVPVPRCRVTIILECWPQNYLFWSHVITWVIAAIPTDRQAIGRCQATILAISTDRTYSAELVAKARLAPQTTRIGTDLILIGHYFAGVLITLPISQAFFESFATRVGRYYCIPVVVYAKSIFHSMISPLMLLNPVMSVIILSCMKGWSKPKVILLSSSRIASLR